MSNNIRTFAMGDAPAWSRAIEQDPQFGSEFYSIQAAMNLLGMAFLAGKLTIKQLTTALGITTDEVSVWIDRMTDGADGLVDEVVSKGETISGLIDQAIDHHNQRIKDRAEFLRALGVNAVVRTDGDAGKSLAEDADAMSFFMGSGMPRPPSDK